MSLTKARTIEKKIKKMSCGFVVREKSIIFAP
jgi:hypothetical protein